LIITNARPIRMLIVCAVTYVSMFMMFGGIVAGYIVVLTSFFVGRTPSETNQQINYEYSCRPTESIIVIFARFSGTLLIIDISSTILALASVIILPERTLADIATLFDNMTNTVWMNDHGSSRVFYKTYGFSSTFHAFEFLRSSLRLSDTIGFVILSFTVIRIAGERNRSLDMIIFRETRINTGIWQLVGTIIMLSATAIGVYFSYMYERGISSDVSMYLTDRVALSLPIANVLISVGREYLLFLTIFGVCLFLPALYSTETLDTDQ